MEEGRPSRTAFGAAGHRASHQLFDRPLVLDDPLALTILGPEITEPMRADPDGAGRLGWRTMRALMVARSRVVEGLLAEAVARGVNQYVLLGAGLDTFAYRNPHAGLKVFEVDYPATQAWKRERLSITGIAVPKSLTYAPIDFERQTLAEGLAKGGVDLAAPAIFAWLGVVPYLTREAIMATLSGVAAFPAGSGVVFDYGKPRENMPPAIRAFAEARAQRVAAIGEPWISFFQPDELARELAGLGFAVIEDLNGPILNDRYFKGRTDGLAVGAYAHVMRASV